MSLVTLQLGQCGNQVGCQLFSSLMADVHQDQARASSYKDYCSTSIERFFTSKQEDGEFKCSSHSSQYHARAVMVDMEPKVIAQTLTEARRSGKWSYSPGQQFCQKRGSGNNWAHGFCSHGPQAERDVLELVRKEVEKCDVFGGFLGLMSLAGGTGSGVGAYITQCLRDAYPSSFIVNQVVWPYHMGEVIVQNYNAMLTLSHLYQTSDAILVMENDSLEKICSQLLSIKKVSFNHMNEVMAHKLCSVLQPCMDESGHTVRTHLGSILEQLVSQPEYKLLTLRNVPHTSRLALKFSTFAWPGLLKHLRQMLIAAAPMEEGIDWSIKVPSSTAATAPLFNRSIANMLMLRGKDVPAPGSPELSSLTSPFYEPGLYTQWLPPNPALPSFSAVSCWTSPRPLFGYEKSAALLSNSECVVAPLDVVVGKAWAMFASRAFVHQYLRHGLMEEDFVDSFASLEQVLTSYKSKSMG